MNYPVDTLLGHLGELEENWLHTLKIHFETKHGSEKNCIICCTCHMVWYLFIQYFVILVWIKCPKVSKKNIFWEQYKPSAGIFPWSLNWLQPQSTHTYAVHTVMSAKTSIYCNYTARRAQVKMIHNKVTHKWSLKQEFNYLAEWPT